MFEEFEIPRQFYLFLKSAYQRKVSLDVYYLFTELANEKTNNNFSWAKATSFF